MRLPNFRRLSSYSVLSLFIFVLILFTAFATISFSLHQQQTKSGAWMTTQSANTKCDQNGEAVIVVLFTNTGANGLQSISVTAKDAQTGLTVGLGTVGAQQSGTAELSTHLQELGNNSVIFNMSWTNEVPGTDVKVADYSAIKCVVTPTSTPEPTPTLAPSATPAPTEEPVHTTFEVELLLHGIGSGGDNANPTARGNPDPVHKTIKAEIDVYDARNLPVINGTGDLVFASDSGSFRGTVDMGTVLSDGSYLIRAKTDKYLRATMPGIKTVQAGKLNSLGRVTLVTGDINNDNLMNILDFNLLMGCYSDLYPAKNCDDTFNADINDDGKVNQFDYNLFLRELTTRGGE